MINIRKAKKGDFEKILKLAEELYEAELPFDKNLNENYYNNQKAKEDLKKLISSRKRTFLVAEENDNLVGYVDGYIIEKEEVYIEKVAYLDHLCVTRKYRKQGIGKILIDEFAKIMKEKGVKYIKLNAFENNIPAVSLYKKEDFKEYSVYYMKEIK